MQLIKYIYNRLQELIELHLLTQTNSYCIVNACLFVLLRQMLPFYLINFNFGYIVCNLQNYVLALLFDFHTAFNLKYYSI